VYFEWKEKKDKMADKPGKTEEEDMVTAQSRER
jgi:hypothetical protein